MNRLLLFLSIVFASMHQPCAEILETVLCVDKCISDCKAYTTTVGACYNGQQLFPEDPSWSTYDILDTLVDENTIQRSFFASANGTCGSTPTDGFSLPLNACIGPFGEPRPWGRLILLHAIKGSLTTRTARRAEAPV